MKEDPFQLLLDSYPTVKEAMEYFDIKTALEAVTFGHALIITWYKMQQKGYVLGFVDQEAKVFHAMTTLLREIEKEL